MADSFDAFEYFEHLRRRRRFPAIVCGVALLLSSAAALLLPKRYTATARVVIEPPGGGDQRVAVAVSPIYLESLRTYERFASSDSLFLGALEHFGLRERNARPVESWKRSVLRVEIPRNTKILEISATLPDPKKAQAMAQYVAQQTVDLSRSLNRAGAMDTIHDAQAQVTEARGRLDRATAEFSRVAAQEPMDTLLEDIRSAEVLRNDLDRQAAYTEMLIAEARESGANAGGASADTLQQQLAESRLRVLKRRMAVLSGQIAAKQELASERATRRDLLLEERKDAEINLAAAEGRLRDVRTAASFRGEELRIVDPGIVPERPSFPNPPLMVAAGVLLAAAISLIYLTIEFGFAARFLRRPAAAAPRRMAAGDD